MTTAMLGDGRMFPAVSPGLTPVQQEAYPYGSVSIYFPAPGRAHVMGQVKDEGVARFAFQGFVRTAAGGWVSAPAQGDRFPGDELSAGALVALGLAVADAEHSCPTLMLLAELADAQAAETAAASGIVGPDEMAVIVGRRVAAERALAADLVAPATAGVRGRAERAAELDRRLVLGV